MGPQVRYSETQPRYIDIYDDEPFSVGEGEVVIATIRHRSFSAADRGWHTVTVDMFAPRWIAVPELPARLAPYRDFDIRPAKRLAPIPKHTQGIRRMSQPSKCR